jgi:hypothetical protein
MIRKNKINIYDSQDNQNQLQEKNKIKWKE